MSIEERFIITCPGCMGRGFITTINGFNTRSDSCSMCGGVGRVLKISTVEYEKLTGENRDSQYTITDTNKL